MEKLPTDFLNINHPKGIASYGLNYYTFMDNGHTIVYIPTVRVSAYGDNFEEAKIMMDEVLTDFCEELLKMPEKDMKKKLLELGFSVGIFNKRFQNRSYVDREGVLRNFNLPKETPVKIEYLQA